MGKRLMKCFSILFPYYIDFIFPIYQSCYSYNRDVFVDWSLLEEICSCYCSSSIFLLFYLNKFLRKMLLSLPMTVNF